MPIAYHLSPKTNQHNSKNTPSSARVRYPFGGGKKLTTINNINHNNSHMTEQELNILLSGRETRTLEYKRVHQ